MIALGSRKIIPVSKKISFSGKKDLFSTRSHRREGAKDLRSGRTEIRLLEKLLGSL
jgi:hypothetical protein